MKFKGLFLAAVLTAVLCISDNLLAYSGGSGYGRLCGFCIQDEFQVIRF